MGLIISLISAFVAIVGLLVSIFHNRKLLKENIRLSKIQLQDRFPFLQLINPSIENQVPISMAMPEETFLDKYKEGETSYSLYLNSYIADTTIQHCTNFWLELQNKSDSIIKDIVVEKIAFQKPSSFKDGVLETIGVVEKVHNINEIKGVWFKDDAIKIKVCQPFEDDQVLSAYSVDTICLSILLKITIISGVCFFENIRYEGYSGTRRTSVSYLHSETAIEI